MGPLCRGELQGGIGRCVSMCMFVQQKRSGSHGLIIGAVGE